MAFTKDKPVIDIEMLDDITASTIWLDETVQYGFGTKHVLELDGEFKQIFHSMFGNAKPDQNFAFASLTNRAFKMIDNVAGIDFEWTKNPDKVDLVLTSTNDKPNGSLEGFFQFPGNSDVNGTEESWSIGAFNSGMGALKAKPEQGGGQYANWTILHEIGHGIGLKHTHNESNGNALSSIGKFMDNERYSVMSYNGASDATKYGHAVSMMALDVAALQQLYGVETYAEDGSEYTLMSAKAGKLSLAEGDVQIGRAYYCIWDSGGNDTMSYEGKGKSVLLNLNDATLDTSGNSDELLELFAQIKETGFYDLMSKQLRDGIFDEWHNAGGFFSQVLDYKKGKFNATDGGFSIANGAEIENAEGGKSHDLIVGNEQDNSINGNNGDDTILGGGGSDRLSGGAGSDWLDGGAGEDYLWGGAGRDRFVFAEGYGPDSIMDFQASDVIDLEEFGWLGVVDVEEFLDEYATQDGDDVVIEIGSDVLVIRNTMLATLNDDNVFIAT